MRCHAAIFAYFIDWHEIRECTLMPPSMLMPLMIYHTLLAPPLRYACARHSDIRRFCRRFRQRIRYIRRCHLLILRPLLLLSFSPPLIRRYAALRHVYCA